MSNYNKWKLTNVGKDYLNRAISEKNAKFALEEVRCSSRTYNYDSVENLTALADVKAQANLYGTSSDSTHVETFATVDNRNVTEGFYINTMGIYGTYNGNNFLFAVTTANTPSYLGKFDGTSLSSLNLAIKFIVSDSQCITVEQNIDGTVNITQFNELKQDLEDLKFILGLNDTVDVYGVELNFYNNTSRRLLNAKGMESKDFSNVPIYQRSLIEYDPVTKKFSTTITDGENKIIMVKQKKFYYRVDYLDVDDKGFAKIVRMYISSTPRDGFKIHPAFVSYDGREMDYILLDTKNRFMNKDLKEVPSDFVGMNFEETLMQADNLGDGWGIQTYETLDMTKLLFAIEHGTLNIQEVFDSLGATDVYDVGNKRWKTGDVIPTSLTTKSSLTRSITDGTLHLTDSFNGYDFDSLVWRGEDNLVGGLRTFMSNCYYILHPDYVDMFINEEKLQGNLMEVSTMARKYYPNGFCDREGLMVLGNTGGNSDNLIGDVLWFTDGTRYNGVKVQALTNGGSTGGVENGLNYINSKYGHSNSMDIGYRLTYTPIKKLKTYPTPTQTCTEDTKDVVMLDKIYIYSKAMDELDSKYRVRLTEVGEKFTIIGYKKYSSGNVRLQTSEGWISGHLNYTQPTHWTLGELNDCDTVYIRNATYLLENTNSTVKSTSVPADTRFLFSELVLGRDENNKETTFFHLKNGSYIKADKENTYIDRNRTKYIEEGYLGEQVYEVKILKDCNIYKECLEEFVDDKIVGSYKANEKVKVLDYRTTNKYTRLKTDKGWITGNTSFVEPTHHTVDSIETNDCVVAKTTLTLYRENTLETTVKTVPQGTELYFKNIELVDTKDTRKTVFRLFNGYFCSTDKELVNVKRGGI